MWLDFGKIKKSILKFQKNLNINPDANNVVVETCKFLT
jgi:hypothetical protein